MHMVVQLVEGNDEVELHSQRATLLRYQDSVWKERGLGDATLLMHKKTGKVRFLLRQENTWTVVCNFYVMNVAPYCELKPHPNSDRTWCGGWTTTGLMELRGQWFRDAFVKWLRVPLVSG